MTILFFQYFSLNIQFYHHNYLAIFYPPNLKNHALLHHLALQRDSLIRLVPVPDY